MTASQYPEDCFHQTIMRARRNSKMTITSLIMQPYLDRGDHVHSASRAKHICYNGSEYCLPFVDEQKFTGPDTPKGS